MKFLFVFLLALLGSFTHAQVYNDSLFYEQRAEMLWNDAVSLERVYFVFLNLDEQLQALDTSSLRDSIKYVLLNEQKEIILNAALNEYNLLLEKFPKSWYAPLSTFRKAEIHRKLGQLDSARYYLLNLVLTDSALVVLARDDSWEFNEKYNLQKDTYIALAEVEYEAENYNRSISYLLKSETAPSYLLCGNEFENMDVETVIIYAKNYYALDSLDKAIEFLLPNIIFNGMANNRALVALAIDYLLEKYDRNYLLSEFEKSFQNYYTLHPKWSGYRKKYYIRYLGEEMLLVPFSPEHGTIPEEQQIQQVMKNELFYKLLKER